MDEYIKRVWERRAVAELWRETAQLSFDSNPCRSTHDELREAICEHEKERAVYDVLTQPGQHVSRTAPMPRAVG